MTHFPAMARTAHAPRRGFLIGDAVLALAIALTILMSLAALVAQQRKAERKLAASRALVRDAETALLQFQSTGARNPDLQIERLPASAPQGAAWIRVSLRRQEPPAASRPLVALVPLKHLPADTPTVPAAPATSGPATPMPEGARP